MKTNSWNPPIKLETPIEVIGKASLLDSDNIRQSPEELLDLANKSGKKPHELISFSAERLVLHALILETTHRIQIPDNATDYLSYGTNFRETVNNIRSKYVDHNIDQLSLKLNDLHKEVENDVERNITSLKESKNPKFLLMSWSASSFETGGYLPTDETRYNITKYSSLAKNYEQLQSRSLSEQEFYSTLKAIVVSDSYNLHASNIASKLIKPIVTEAIKKEDYNELTVSENDNIAYIVKGAPGTGKSTARARFKKASESIEKVWDDILKLNPDIWRKLLLDPESLGTNKNYWGVLTDNELTILIDKFTTQYVYNKETPHADMMLDRFYPDKRELNSVSEYSKQTYLVIMFTEPHLLIDRVYERGVRLNRHMPTEVTLANSILTNQLIPSYLTSCLGNNIEFEIVSNSGPKGSAPKTAIFGNLAEKEMNIVDVKSLFLLNQYTKLNFKAKNAEELFTDDDKKPSNNLDILLYFGKKLNLNFVDEKTFQVYASFEGNTLAIHNEELFNKKCGDEFYKEAFDALKMLKGQVRMEAVTKIKEPKNIIGTI